LDTSDLADLVCQAAVHYQNNPSYMQGCKSIGTKT
jgi:hypothetical protein